MASFSRLRNKPEIEAPEINLTALIDVVFTVLIMFILIAPLIDLEQVQLAQRGKKEDAINSSNIDTSIVIYVQADNTIQYKKSKILPQQLVEALKSAKRSNPRAIPRVYHDKRATFGTYQTVKNAAEMAGFSQIDIILEQ